MSHHTAAIHWQRAEGEAFTDKRYHRRHTWRFDGGAEVAGSSSPDVVRVPYSDPSAVDPEEAFVAALSSCHLLWFLDFASRCGWQVDDYADDAVGEMGPDARGRLVFTRVVLRPRVRFAGARVPDRATLQRLHHDAHGSCFIANSVTCEVVCEIRD